MQILDYCRPQAGLRPRRLVATVVAGGCVIFLLLLAAKRALTRRAPLPVTISSAPASVAMTPKMPPRTGDGYVVASMFLVLKEQNVGAQPVFVCPSTQPSERAEPPYLIPLRRLGETRRRGDGGARGRG
jgi:hypothetical protein